MSRNAFVPMTWITSDLSGEALRTLILLSTFADGNTGECHPSNALLAKTLGKSARSIQLTIQELKTAGLISIVDFNGRRRTIKIMSPEWFDRPTRKVSIRHEEKLHGRHEENLRPRGEEKLHGRHEENLRPRGEEKLHGRHEEKLHGRHEENLRPLIRTHPMNTPIEHSSGVDSARKESKPVTQSTTTTNQNLEPFESGMATRLPQVRNGVESFRQRTIEIVPTSFKPETRDKILTVLGTEGDQFARKVSQAQADAGFVDWILDEAKKNRTPVKLAFHLLKTAWREGWVSPKAEEEAKRAARRKRLEALK